MFICSLTHEVAETLGVRAGMAYSSVANRYEVYKKVVSIIKALRFLYLCLGSTFLGVIERGMNLDAPVKALNLHKSSASPMFDL